MHAPLNVRATRCTAMDVAEVVEGLLSEEDDNGGELVTRAGDRVETAWLKIVRYYGWVHRHATDVIA